METTTIEAAESGYSLGYRFDTDPIPPVPAFTQYIDAEPLTIAVEARQLTDDLIADAYKDDPEGLAALMKVRGDNAPADKGIAIHIIEKGTDKEFVRFDMFFGDPHYHYLFKTGGTVSIPFDVNAHGDIFVWALGCIQGRLPDMLKYAGADDLALRLNHETLQQAVPEVLRAREWALSKLDSLP
jgi:hypothetical protein